MAILGVVVEALKLAVTQTEAVEIGPGLAVAAQSYAAVQASAVTAPYAERRLEACRLFLRNRPTCALED